MHAVYKPFVVLAVLLAAAPARADQPPGAQPPPDETSSEPASAEEEAAARASAEFRRGAELVKDTKWSEALAAFERAAGVLPHAVTSYNMGACLRAMGRYVLARKRFVDALALDDAAERAQLSSTLREDTEAILREIDGTLARARITLEPASAAITVDGRPLELYGKKDATPVLLAGTLPAGRGEKAPAKRFDVLLDPGSHVFTLTRTGYSDAVVPRTFAAGQTVDLDLTIARLPARVVIGANPDGAVVSVDGKDVGSVPVELSRHAGTYRVVVEKEGYVPYEQTVSLEPGQKVNITAELPVEQPALYEEWWFWTAMAGAAATVAVTAYVIARPDPERPPPDGGGLGWVVEVP
jgi:hypothetical protein